MYTNLGWCATLVLSELGLAAEPHDLRVSLAAAAGTDPDGTQTFRPYLYCAQRLDSDGELSTAKGGTTFRVDPRVLAYLKRQAQLDSALKLTVPPGTEAIVSEQRPLAFSGGISTRVVW